MDNTNTTGYGQISKRKLVVGYPCLTKAADGSIHVNELGPTKNYKTLSVLEKIYQQVQSSKKLIPSTIKVLTGGFAVFVIYFIGSFIYINQKAIHQQFIALIPIIQISEKPDSQVALSAPLKTELTTQIETKVEPQSSVAQPQKVASLVPTPLLPTPIKNIAGLPLPTMETAKQKNKKTAIEIEKPMTKTTEPAISVTLAALPKPREINVGTNEPKATLIEQSQWKAVTFNDEQLVMMNQGNIKQFSSGQTLPTGEVLKSIDTNSNQYTTDRGTFHLFKGVK